MHVSRDALADVIKSMSGDLDEIAGELTDAIHDNIDELEDDLRIGTHLSCRSNVGMIMTMLGDEVRPSAAVPGPEALAYAKEYVRRQHGFDLLERAYRTGQARFSQIWLDALRERADDADSLAHTFGYFNEWLFAWVETLEARLTEYYMYEREHYLSGASAMRAEQVQSILDGSPIDVAATSLRLRYDLDRTHLAFVVWAEDGGLGSTGGHVLLGAMERQASETAELLGARDHLTVPLGGYMAAWTGFRGPLGQIKLPDKPPSPSHSQLHIAFGEPGPGVPGFRRSHEEALMARRVHQLRRGGPSSCVRFADVSLDALLIQNPREARRFVARQLGELAADTDAAARLRATVAVFLQENASFVHAARRLGVHENTILYRIRRAEKLLGHEVKNCPVELQTALRLSRLSLP
jgi:DNA-binding PucR family transcriptional regulator